MSSASPRLRGESSPYLAEFPTARRLAAFTRLRAKAFEVRSSPGRRLPLTAFAEMVTNFAENCLSS
jgi:hypothetical protein